MNDDERKCPDCAEIIKRDAKVCRHCGKTFSDRELRAVFRDAPTAAERAIDEAIIAASPTWTREFGGVPILYHGARNRSTVRRSQIEELASQTPYSFDTLRNRFEAIGWCYADTEEEADEIQAERDQKRAESLARASRIRTQSSTDSQYGVLQPLANATAGCFGLWQWLIFLFLIALIIVGIRSIFE